MALTATATQGFELLRRTTDHEVLWLPSDPGVTYTRGDRVVVAVGEGVVTLAAANEGGLAGTVLQTVTSPASTVPFPKPGEFDPVDYGASSYGAIVPVRVDIPAGLPIMKATFKNHVDDTVASYAAADGIGATTGHTADDYPNGALLYVYEGPGIGEVNVVADYDHTLGAAELLVVPHRQFATALTTASKYIVLTGEAATLKGVSMLGRCEGADEDELTVNEGANDGDYVVFMSWQDMTKALKNLTLHVIPAKYLLAA